MPVPDYPENRRESYLNNIATGSGEIPPYPENREEQYLDAIARNGGGGSGSGLPEVSAADNGDVLTVVEGAWAKAAPSGGGGALVVNLDMQTMTLDKTWQEIYDSAFAVITENAEEGEKAWIMVYYAYEHDGIYEVEAFAPGPGTSLSFVADSADGYPVMQQDGGD